MDNTIWNACLTDDVLEHLSNQQLRELKLWLGTLKWFDSSFDIPLPSFKVLPLEIKDLLLWEENLDELKNKINYILALKQPHQPQYLRAAQYELKNDVALREFLSFGE